VIEVSALTKSYGGVTAVDGLSFTVGEGEVLGLVGPNGAGKTTTLRSLAGIIAPTSGTIRIVGQDLRTDPVAAKRLLAFVPDEPHLFEYLTLDEHLQFVARIYGVEDWQPRAAALLETLELGEQRTKLPDQLSRGMKQKLAIACALLHQPRALILDEPLTGLDPAGMRRMKSTIVEQARGGAAVLLSSHLLQLVEELCDRILVIRSGKAVFLGGLEEIAVARPELEGLGLEDVFLALTERPEPR
jgi:ABC-2 type transport system ATP-binding protein